MTACALVLAVTTAPAEAEAGAGAAAVAPGEPTSVGKLVRPGTAETGATIAAQDGATYVASTSTSLDGEQEQGRAARQVVVAQVDARGDEVWSRRDGTDYLDSAVDVVAGSWGALVLSSGSTTVNGWDSPAGFSVTRYDPEGARVWTRWRGSETTVSGLALHGDSYYVVGMDSVQRFDLATGQLRRQHTARVRWSSVAVLGGDLVVLGDGPRGADSDELVLRRLDGQTLTVEWTKTLDASAQDIAADVAVSGGRVLVSGLTTDNLGPTGGDFALLLADYGADGTPGWQHRFPFGAVPGSPTLAATSTGSAVFSTEYTILGDRLGMTLRTFDDDGTLVSEGFVGEQYALATATDVAWDAAAGLRVAGSDDGDTFDPPTDDADTFLAGTSPARLPVQARLKPRRLVLRPGTSRASRLLLTNRGSEPLVVSVRGCRNPGDVRLKVRSGGADVTRAVRKGTWRSRSLPRGASVRLTIKAHAARTARPRTNGCSFRIGRPGTSAVPFEKYLRIRVVRRDRG